MKRIPLAAVAASALGGWAATPVMADSGDIHHYRVAFGQCLVCTNRWANYDPCSRVSLAEVKRIDALAEDACRQGEDIIPHALYGDAGALNYQCVNGRMHREPYWYHFDAQGYQIGNWVPVR